ncbi:DUF2905 domain-containing protein [bacterium]|nr:DUF2905 domain-containing protein [bacterium]MCI0614944.1 DUF2905 domain-containing protein [bacterium]
MVTLDFGKALIIAGIVLFLVGLIFSFAGSIPWLGRLPGDIHIKKDGFQFYFPIVTCILISLLLTAILVLFRRG